MYTSFYNLKEKPFEIAPDPRFLYLSESHREALAHLIYAVKERKGFTVITGEVGTGKTVLIQTLLSRLDGKTRTAYLFNPKLGPTDFLSYICEDLGLKGIKRYKGQTLNILHSFLLNCYTLHENVILIVDEAQGLDAQLLEEVRLLTNFETSQGKLLQLILVGQPELDEVLNRTECRQLKQRVSLRFNVRPLNKEEMKEYIEHRLVKAGAFDTGLFTPKALDHIYRYSKGIPRLINIVCDNALLIGYAVDQKVIGDKIINEAIENLEGPACGKKRKRSRALRLILLWILGLTAMAAVVKFGVLQYMEVDFSQGLGTVRDTVGRMWENIFNHLNQLL
ncbi:MAG: ATPase [Deltaproteobacteria bacterium]|nr:MAG: ATPase [Deltaproteobacteria bacterium]